MSRRKTLAELYEPPSTFRHDRHAALIKRRVLTAEDIALILDREAAGFAVWQTAALLECSVGLVANALRLHRPTVDEEPMHNAHAQFARESRESRYGKRQS